MISKDIRDYYKQNLAQHGPDAKGMGWKDKNAQQVRFDQLSKVFHTEPPFSVNDLGCGVGHFLTYLNDKFGLTQYNGYDVMREMIEKAEKEFKGSPKAHFHLIQSSLEMKKSDYSIASGIFNLKFDRSIDEWKAYIIETLDHLDASSECGFSFNALTSYSDQDMMKQELFYADPLWLFDHCKKRFAKNVALLHDYSQYDFTILVKKNF